MKIYNCFPRKIYLKLSVKIGRFTVLVMKIRNIYLRLICRPAWSHNMNTNNVNIPVTSIITDLNNGLNFFLTVIIMGRPLLNIKKIVSILQVITIV